MSEPNEPTRNDGPDGGEAREEIRILASMTPNPDSLKFTVDRPILRDGSAFFRSPEEGGSSPLAARIFALGNVTSLFFCGDMITANKSPDADWMAIARPIGQAIREHIWSGEPAVGEEATSQRTRSEAEAKIEEVLAEIRPWVQQDGGDIVFAGFDGNVVHVYMQGACSGCPSSTMTLRMGIEERLRAVLPEVERVEAI